MRTEEQFPGMFYEKRGKSATFIRHYRGRAHSLLFLYISLFNFRVKMVGIKQKIPAHTHIVFQLVIIEFLRSCFQISHLAYFHPLICSSLPLYWHIKVGLKIFTDVYSICTILLGNACWIVCDRNIYHFEQIFFYVSFTKINEFFKETPHKISFLFFLYHVLWEFIKYSKKKNSFNIDYSLLMKGIWCTTSETSKRSVLDLNFFIWEGGFICTQ